MHNILQPLFIILLFVCIRSGDLAITSNRAHDTARTILYGLVSILALIGLVVPLLPVF